jgi:adenylyltransferase/sulfurtransferase
MGTARAARLRDASILVVGVGALGSAAAEALADAGIGRLTLIDPDVVERSNLHRQLLHRTADLGLPKVDSAAAKLVARHPSLSLTLLRARLDATTVDGVLPGHDCVIDATDGIETKFFVNDAAVRLGVTLVHGGILRFLGQLMTIVPRRSACYRCLFGAPPPASDVPSCQEAGVLGSLAGTIGVLQAAEAVRIVTGVGALVDRLLTYDALSGRWRHVRVRRNPTCPACGTPAATPSIRAAGRRNASEGAPPDGSSHRQSGHATSVER